MLTEFQINLNEIIEQRRQIVKEKKDSGISDGEKDLLTLMIESEEGGDKEGLTNEELQVVWIVIKLECTQVTPVLEQFVYFLYRWSRYNRKYAKFHSI